MRPTRYKYEDTPITVEQAKEKKINEIKAAKHEIKHRRSQIEDCQAHIKRLMSRPLPTTVRVQYALHPGDEGYNECSPQFNEGEYQGDFKWINIPT